MSFSNSGPMPPSERLRTLPFQLLSEYPLGTPGGVCYFCKSARRNGERVVDTFILIDFEGPLTFCESCAREVAHLLGMPSEREAEALREDNARLRERLDDASVRADSAETALDALRRYDLVRPAPLADILTPPLTPADAGTTPAVKRGPGRPKKLTADV